MPNDIGAPSSDHHFGVISALGLIDLKPRSLGESPYLFEKLFRSLRHKNMCTPLHNSSKGGYTLLFPQVRYNFHATSNSNRTTPISHSRWVPWNIRVRTRERQVRAINTSRRSRCQSQKRTSS